MVVLVRHAESHHPAPGGPDDHNRSLTARGHAQAEALVDALAALAPVAVVSSPYLRAAQTVAPLARRIGVSVGTDPELREWDSGLTPRPDYAEHYAASWAVQPGHVDPAVYRVRFLADAVDVDGPALPERTTPPAASKSRT